MAWSEVYDTILANRGERWAERAVAALDAEHEKAAKLQRRREVNYPEWARVSAPDEVKPSEVLGGPSTILPRIEAACAALRAAESERQTSIVEARQAGLTLAAIAKAAGVTPERVRQLTTS
jgi:hypothetical protein